MEDKLSTLLKSKGYLVADGAIGTNLFAMGLEIGAAPDMWNISEEEKVFDLHSSFVKAGSDIITTNTFGANYYRLKLHKNENDVVEINKRGVQIAREVADAEVRPIIVAASIGPTGEIFEPVGEFSASEGKKVFAEQAVAQADAGADVHWIETISSAEELTAAVSGVSCTGLPIVFTMTFDTVGRTMMGLTAGSVVKLAGKLDAQLKSQGMPGIIAFGANCGVGPATLIDTILGLTSETKVTDIVVAKGNCGIPVFQDGEIMYSGTPEIMATYACLARDSGATIIGGCCGTTANHVKAMTNALLNHKPGKKPELHTVESRLGRIDTPAPSKDKGNRRRKRRHSI